MKFPYDSYAENAAILPIGTKFWYRIWKGILIEVSVTGYNFISYNPANPDEREWIDSNNISKEKIEWKRGTIFYDCDIPIGHSGTLDTDGYCEFYSTIANARYWWSRRHIEDRRVDRRSLYRPHRKIVADVVGCMKWIWSTHNTPYESACSQQQIVEINRLVSEMNLPNRKFVKLI